MITAFQAPIGVLLTAIGARPPGALWAVRVPPEYEVQCLMGLPLGFTVMTLVFPAQIAAVAPTMHLVPLTRATTGGQRPDNAQTAGQMCAIASIKAALSQLLSTTTSHPSSLAGGQHWETSRSMARRVLPGMWCRRHRSPSSVRLEPTGPPKVTGLMLNRCVFQLNSAFSHEPSSVFRQVGRRPCTKVQTAELYSCSIMHPNRYCLRAADGSKAELRPMGTDIWNSCPQLAFLLVISYRTKGPGQKIINTTVNHLQKHSMPIRVRSFAHKQLLYLDDLDMF